MKMRRWIFFIFVFVYLTLKNFWWSIVISHNPFFLIREHLFTKFSRLNSKSEVKDSRLDAKPNAKTQKNPRPRPTTDFPRTDPFEAKDRNVRNRGPRTQPASVLQKKLSQIFRKIQAFSRRSSSIIHQVSGVLQDEEKKMVMILAHV